jgi:restriction endonuclease Mrr
MAGLSYTDSAERVLEKAGKQLKYTEIVDTAIKGGLLKTESQTPSISMYVSLRDEIKRREQRQEKQRFVFRGKGYFDLFSRVRGEPAKKTQSALDQIKNSRDEAMKELFSRLIARDTGTHFEAMVGDLLIAMGYADVDVIGGKDDQGVDIICSKRDGLSVTRYAIQCKCKKLNNQIGPKDISNLRDNISSYQCQQGIFITTSYLNDTAKQKAKEAGKEPIQTIEHEGIMSLFADYEIGITKEPISYYQIDESTYDFLRPAKKSA